MNLLQAWLIVGVPALVVAGALFVGRSRWRTALGYVVLVATALVLGAVSRDPFSPAIVGFVGVLLVAGGRGTWRDTGPEEHHDRKRYTTDPSHA